MTGTQVPVHQVHGSHPARGGGRAPAGGSRNPRMRRRARYRILVHADPRRTGPAGGRAVSSAGQDDGRADGRAGAACLVRADVPGTHARHRTGNSATDLQARLAGHERDQGARQAQVQPGQGRTRRLAPAGPGTRDRETQLNERGASRRYQIRKDETQAAATEPAALEPEPEPAAGQ
jgi:hypothetical protein